MVILVSPSAFLGEVLLFGDGSRGVLWHFWFLSVFEMVPDECYDISVWECSIGVHLLRWLWTAFCARWWPPVLYIKRAPKFVLGFPPTPIWIKHYIDKLDVVLGLRLVGKTKQRQQDNKANAQQKKNVARGIFEQRCTLVIVSLSVREYGIEVRYGAIWITTSTSNWSSSSAVSKTTISTTFHHIKGFWQSSTRCIKHQCDCCGPVSTLNNPGMAWTKESHGKRQLKRRPLICELLWLSTCLSEELLENSIASKSHFEGKNTCTLLYSHPDRNRSPWSRGA